MITFLIPRRERLITPENLKKLQRFDRETESHTISFIVNSELPKYDQDLFRAYGIKTYQELSKWKRNTLVSLFGEDTVCRAQECLERRNLKLL
jgi:hypothetical protein